MADSDNQVREMPSPVQFFENKNYAVHKDLRPGVVAPDPEAVLQETQEPESEDPQGLPPEPVPETPTGKTVAEQLQEQADAMQPTPEPASDAVPPKAAAKD